MKHRVWVFSLSLFFAAAAAGQALYRVPAPKPGEDHAATINATWARRHPLKYPAEAVKNHWTGKAVVRVRIGTDGSVREATIERSTGQDILDEAALATAREQKFGAAVSGGKPVESYVLVPYTFSLQH